MIYQFFIERKRRTRNTIKYFLTFKRKYKCNFYKEAYINKIPIFYVHILEAPILFHNAHAHISKKCVNNNMVLKDEY